jgi:hypothetical protein
LAFHIKRKAKIMNIPSKEDTIKKWAPILESMGMTESKAEWMSEYVEIHSKNETTLSSITTEEFPTLLPIAKQIFAKTIGLDLVSVAPIGGGNSGPEMETIRQDVKIENRDRKIESIVEDKEFEEMKVEDHPDYKESVGPRGDLFYLDFQYGGTESNTIL